MKECVFSASDLVLFICSRFPVSRSFLHFAQRDAPSSVTLSGATGRLTLQQQRRREMRVQSRVRERERAMSGRVREEERRTAERVQRQQQQQRLALIPHSG